MQRCRLSRTHQQDVEELGFSSTIEVALGSSGHARGLSMNSATYSSSSMMNTARLFWRTAAHVATKSAAVFHCAASQRHQRVGNGTWLPTEVQREVLVRDFPHRNKTTFVHAETLRLSKRVTPTGWPLRPAKENLTRADCLHVRPQNSSRAHAREHLQTSQKRKPSWKADWHPPSLTLRKESTQRRNPVASKTSR